MGQSILTMADAAGAGAHRVDGSLYVEGISLERIARSVGTPAYVYSAAMVRERYARLAAMLAPVPHRIHYTLKANSNRALLRLLRELGAGADVVSGGELYRALGAGFAPNEIIFGGVGKTEGELRQALETGILLLNVESEREIRLVARTAEELGMRAPVSIRINPEITVDTAHHYIKTGERGHKFGIPYDEAVEMARLAASFPNVDLLGLDMHLGSQLSRIDPYRHGTQRLLEVHAQLLSEGITSIRYLDVGGGLGVRYDTEQHPDLDRFADLVLPGIAAAGLTLILEPGRFVVGNAGVLLTRVLYRKRSGGKDYVIVDGGMTELLRPSHYGAFHRIQAVRERPGRAVVDVVGPVCESGDFLALDRELDDVEPGDLLAVLDVGAYGYGMASNYNSRPRPCEVLVDGARYATVTRRETHEDLTRLEMDHPDWRS